jgi:hypothetical protein
LKDLTAGSGAFDNVATAIGVLQHGIPLWNRAEDIDLAVAVRVEAEGWNGISARGILFLR